MTTEKTLPDINAIHPEPVMPEIIDPDIHVITINVGIQGFIQDVFLDCGSKVNVISIGSCQRLGITDWVPALYGKPEINQTRRAD